MNRRVEYEGKTYLVTPMAVFVNISRKGVRWSAGAVAQGTNLTAIRAIAEETIQARSNA